MRLRFSARLLGIGFVLTASAGARASGIGTCVGGENCVEPCPAEGACVKDADCSGDQFCGPPPPGVCVPTDCACSPFTHGWACTDLCVNVCQLPVPATSAWGLLVLGILTLVGGSIVLRKSATHRGTKVRHYCAAGLLMLLSSTSASAEVVRIDVADVAAFEELNVTPCAFVD